ncbi:hemagglutinin repeat-containing protein, partial [Glaciimonas sp. GG7]
LNAAKAGLIAANAIKQVAVDGTTPALAKVTVSIGGGSSDSDSSSQASQHQGSTLAAGKDLTLIATGNGSKDSAGFAADGDIHAKGADISAQNVTLAAARDINLKSAKDTTLHRSKNDGSNASIGIGLGIGGEQNGFTLELAASRSKGTSNGDSTTHHNTSITASDSVTLASGRDTHLIGAEVRGDSVNASVGRDLTIHSQQDTDNYHSRQDNSGLEVSLCVPPFCVGNTVSAKGNIDSANVDSSYASVNQQSGIIAGSGGYDLHVKGNTDLIGGLIASSADLEKNSLTTGTLTTKNVQNKADYSSDTSSISASVSLGKSVPDSIDPNTNQVIPAHI